MITRRKMHSLSLSTRKFNTTSIISMLIENLNFSHHVEFSRRSSSLPPSSCIILFRLSMIMWAYTKATQCCWWMESSRVNFCASSDGWRRQAKAKTNVSWGRFEWGDKPDFCHEQQISNEMTRIIPVIQLQSSSKSEHRQQTSMRWKMYLVNRVMSMFELCRFCVQFLSLDRQRPQQQHPYSLSSTLDISSNLSPHSLLIRDKHTRVVRVGVGVVIPVI